jgi:hypothetical protein
VFGAAFSVLSTATSTNTDPEPIAGAPVVAFAFACTFMGDHLPGPLASGPNVVLEYRNNDDEEVPIYKYAATPLIPAAMLSLLTAVPSSAPPDQYTKWSESVANPIFPWANAPRHAKDATAVRTSFFIGYGCGVFVC